MPKSFYKELKRRGGVKRWATIHPPGRPDVFLRIAVPRKKGKKGGATVAGEVHHKLYS